jgi:Rap1a immunity proteins
MKIRGLIAVAALVLLAPLPTRAATEANFDARTTGDLVALCSATPDNGIGTAALNFCEGLIQGAVTVEMQNMAAFRGRKLFCLPDPPPTRAQAMSEFVGWVQAAPDRAGQPVTDGLFRFLNERYPCPASP